MNPSEKTKTAAPAAFEITIKAALPLQTLKIRSLGELLFNKLSHRSEDCHLFCSHLDSAYIALSLQQVRQIVCRFFKTFDASGLHRGDTVALVRIDGCSELPVALLFLALTVKGIRVLLPMYADLEAFPKWIGQWQCKAIITQNTELQNLHSHFLEREQMRLITNMASEKNLLLLDTEADFGIRKLLLQATAGEISDRKIPDVHLTDLGQADDEVLVISTSGSTGVPDMVTYQQIAFLQSCQSWQSAGLFHPELLGGRGFTPLFTHTMGIRQLFNALWTGQAVCLISTSWFLEKPETVAFLLEKMQPNHITGGPSVYRLLLELVRNFPKLKQSLGASFKQFISSGAPFDLQTAGLLFDAFNIHMHNAFGTTETQQVLNTLMDNDLHENAWTNEFPMGLPLPGVEIGLEKLDSFDDYYRLHFRAPFMHYRILRGNQSFFHENSGFYYTGDIVQYRTGKLYYTGREKQDFLNDGFGVKVPLPFIRKNYREVFQHTVHHTFIPFEEDPGLGLLLFINNPQLPEGTVHDISILNRHANLISSINHQLESQLPPFEYQHFTVRQLALVNDNPPLTNKGNVSSFLLKERYRTLFELLKHYGIRHPSLVQVDKRCGKDHAFRHYLSPYIGRFLNILGMDYSYHRGKKDTLFTYRFQQEIPILDFTGGYGTNFLGHNHPEIKKLVRRFLKEDEVAVSDQLSIQQYAGLLARALNREVSTLTGRSYRVQLVSTGSEAVELALHHAWIELRKRLSRICRSQFQAGRGMAPSLFYASWRENFERLNQCKPVVIGLKHAFHGNTSGARSLLHTGLSKEKFNPLLAVRSLFVDDEAEDWASRIDQIISEAGIFINKLVWKNGDWQVEQQFFSTILAAIAEPVQGEGGVRLVNREVLAHLNRFEFPLILDEIQSGLGRTGSFITFPDIPADYYLFGKALGGNMAKISAVLIAEERFQPGFQRDFVSTFANSGLASKIALRTISLISEQHLAERAREAGGYLNRQLLKLQRKYPRIIAGIGGRGLLAGIRFRHFNQDDCLLLRTLCQSERAGYLYSAYLLKKHQIRIFPSLSAPNTLRVEPSAYITKNEIRKLVGGLDDLCELLDRNAFYELLQPLMDDDPFDDNKGVPVAGGPILTLDEPPAAGAVQVAFIAHFAYVAEELRALEPDLVKASDTGLYILFNKLQQLLEWRPVKIFSKNIFNQRIHFTFYALPADAASLERLCLDGKRQKITGKIQETAELAAKEGARFISLGGFSSILTNNALSVVAPNGAKVISGNTLTVATGIKQILRKMDEATDFPEKSTLVVIGASGNIGSAVVEYFMKNPLRVAKIILLGRREKKLKNTLGLMMKNNHRPGSPVLETSTSLHDCQQADVIVVATNSNAPLLFPHHIPANRKVIISDVSIPSAVSKAVAAMPNVSLLPFAAYVSLPHDPTLKMSSHTPAGTAFCCAAETILCALQPNELHLKGAIRYDEVVAMMNLAEKQDLYRKIGPVKSFNPK